MLVAGCSFNLPARTVCATGTSCSGGDGGTNPDMAPDYNDPGSAGAFKVASTPLTLATSLDLEAGSTIYMPSDNGTTLSAKQATYPVVLLAPALRLMDYSQMAPYAQRLASHGIVVIQYRPSDETDQIAYRMGGQGLTNALVMNQEPALANHIDTARIGLAGYDLGAEMSVAIAAQNQTLAGLFLIDPKVVGASDMTVQIDGLAEMPKVRLSGSHTLVILGEDVSKTGQSGAPPCTNPTQNYEQFYAASTNSAIQIAFPSAAHADFVNTYPDAFACGGGIMQKSDTQTLAIKYMSAYFQWTLLGQSSAMDALSGAGYTADAQKYGLSRMSK